MAGVYTVKCIKCGRKLTNEGDSSMVAMTKCGHVCCSFCMREIARAGMRWDSSYNLRVPEAFRGFNCPSCGAVGIVIRHFQSVIFDIDAVHKKLEDLHGKFKLLKENKSLRKENDRLRKQIMSLIEQVIENRLYSDTQEKLNLEEERNSLITVLCHPDL
ncbi:hypothetical protein LIER_24182 [Lithospermum erythrorhizon]|uniref:RING-type domain-containing protein n=1 Tax=Lithospermum erythrorhizon TaxID=34254 RepID=A0AAV3R3W8_LITER